MSTSTALQFIFICIGLFGILVKPGFVPHTELYKKDFPIMLLPISGSIVYEKLDKPRLVSRENCGLLCKYTAECKGMAYTNSSQQCQLISFDEYKFTETTSSPDEQVFLRQFTFWNESEYFFRRTCPEAQVLFDYMERLKKLEITTCEKDIKIAKSETSYVGNVGTFNPATNGTEVTQGTVYDAGRRKCEHGCPKKKYLRVTYDYQDREISNMNRILANWPAVCYNEEWFYFDLTSQLVIPVKSWSWMEKEKSSPEDDPLPDDYALYEALMNQPTPQRQPIKEPLSDPIGDPFEGPIL